MNAAQGHASATVSPSHGLSKAKAARETTHWKLIYFSGTGKMSTDGISNASWHPPWLSVCRCHGESLTHSNISAIPTAGHKSPALLHAAENIH